MPTLQPSHTRARACRADQAGQYLIAYEQSERHLPMLICERVDTTHGVLHEHPTREQDGRRDPPSILWRAPTCPPFPPLSSDRTCRGQSFAKIPQADAAQHARLPGFGLKKVAGLKDAFERPFRTGTAVDALPAAAAASCLRGGRWCWRGRCPSSGRCGCCCG